MKFVLKIVTFVTKKSEAKKSDLKIGQPRREAELTNAISVQRKWLQTLRKRETAPVGRSSENKNFVTKNRTKILKMERGVLKKETTISEEIGAL